MNDCMFLVPLASRKKVKEVCKMDRMHVSTKNGGYRLKLAPWFTKLGDDGKVTGVGQWVLVWNLPLHG